MLSRYLPILRWGRRYTPALFADDALAALIVTIMLIPQSLAYALIAGLPPEVGLYASMAPLLAYAVFGTSNTLAVGPVAVVSLMTASAVGRLVEAGGPDYIMAAAALALITGVMLLALGVLRLGFLANFLSHPIIAGFITASGVLIAASQMKHVLGVSAHGDTLVEIGESLGAHLGQTNPVTLAIGAGSILFLFLTRAFLQKLLHAAGLSERLAASIAKAGPLLAVIGATAIVAGFGLEAKGVAIVGDIPRGLPPVAVPDFDAALWRELAGAAFLITIIGYVESVSVAQTLAAKRRERIDLDQELVGLGASNIAAGVTGGFPVTGGFARSVVNFDAGARTPAAGAFTAAGIALAALFLTPFLYYLPQATLAATIIVAVLSLINIGAIRRTWAYSKSDFAAMMITIFGVFLFGVEVGVTAGVALSILLLLFRASKPHCAIVGQVPGTEHFRNINRHDVITSPSVAALRIDGNLFFANARFLEDKLLGLAADAPELRHIVLMCSAVNEIDASALESLEAINERLKQAGVVFHLSEVKGPVMDRLKHSHFLERLTGRVFLSQFDAMHALAPETFKLVNGAPSHQSADVLK
ncbi:SulP family inorganic anion transporter [Hyphococcus luteus]|uniref:Sodium-independent anion transporter n=1 Tax=Hyphococcus luteus TaxID=2058213 RepID=A0A2S7K4N5_9PROT|nr:sulfate permease [Marinicaulis flavus]PQA87436.1 sodium-independent anion transporter [Marinicaulis flavus]